MQPRASSAPSIASASAPVDSLVLFGVALRVTPTTVVEPVPGAPAGIVVVGLATVGVVVATGGTAVAGVVVVGATVPGWAPPEEGVVVAGVVAAGVVVAGAGVVVVPWMRADAGIEIPGIPF
jgi:hypothetical protein